MTDGLADIMQKGRPLDQLHIHLEFRGHNAGNKSGLTRMGKIVLPVACAIFQTPQQGDQLRVNILKTDIKDNLFGLLTHQFIQFLFNFFDHLLDPGRVNSPIGHEAFKRYLGDLPPVGIKTRNDHRIRSIVNDQIDTRRTLQGADVATFPADDAPFHALTGQTDR